MAKIQSDASVASTCATAIQSGASGITAVGAPTKDSNSDIVVIAMLQLTSMERQVVVAKLLKK